MHHNTGSTVSVPKPSPSVLLNSVQTWITDRRGLLLLICLSAIIKGIFLIALLDKTINSDGVIYISAAKEFAQGNIKEGFSIYPMPFYPLLISLFHIVIPDWLMAARIISVLSVILAIIPLYLLTRDLFGSQAAFLGCLAFILAPMNQEWTPLIYRGPVYLLCMSWAIYMAHLAIRTQKTIYYPIAMLLGFTTVLIRVEGLLFVMIGFIFLAVRALFKKAERGSHLKGILVSFVLLLLVGGVIHLSLGRHIQNFNKYDEIKQKVDYLVTLKFLDNYRHIYRQLENVEESSIYPIGNKNFGELARHLIWLIYLIGLLQTFFKVLYPSYIIPLIFAPRQNWSASHYFLVTLMTAYILLLYYFLIEKDFISRRFLFAPAFILYPFVGAGLFALITRVRNHAKARWIYGAFALLFLVAPITGYASLFEKPDQVTVQAAEWLKHPPYRHASMVHNDLRIPFMADRKLFTSEKKRNVHFVTVNRNFGLMEKVARQHKADLIVLKIRNKDEKYIPPFQKYRQVEKFSGKKKAVLIFERKPRK